MRCLKQTCDFATEIGDFDLNRNLKIRTFVGFVLAPVFRQLQPHLNYAKMGESGVTAMQYFAEFENFPAPFGYGDDFSGRYKISLCRSLSRERRGPAAELQDVERLILQTQATLTSCLAIGAPIALGFEPETGPPATAGRGRALHVLTRPNNPPGQRFVTEVPAEIAFLRPQALDGPYPTIPDLANLEPGLEELPGGAVSSGGIWGLANSDVYQHIHAREFIFVLENAITTGLAQIALPVQAYTTRRARMIFRRPSFVGQRYAASVRLHRRDDQITALGAFHAPGEDPFADPTRASVYLRFDGALG